MNNNFEQVKEAFCKTAQANQAIDEATLQNWLERIEKFIGRDRLIATLENCSIDSGGLTFSIGHHTIMLGIPGTGKTVSDQF
jgi:Holliday junction resolvasome RuvABC ATP-dependent DNA helicase subunit